jgi:hypothetical protein
VRVRGVSLFKREEDTRLVFAESLPKSDFQFGVVWSRRRGALARACSSIHLFSPSPFLPARTILARSTLA